MPPSRDIIIVGGGPSGLAAAYEAERAGLRYTLIEVKPRLGGRVMTHRADGFVMDGGPFAFEPQPTPTLHELDLADAFFEVERGPLPSVGAFADGAGALVDALAARLKSGNIITRMAVTSVGEAVDGTYDVCLENGLALNARGVLLAAPARYTERMLRTLSPEVAAAFENYHYDAVTTVALGYRAGNRPADAPAATPDMFFARLFSTGHPARVPEGGLLVQAALRVPPGSLPGRKLVEMLTEGMGWPAPDVSLVHGWEHAYPLTVNGPRCAAHTANDALPAGVQLAGTCYTPGGPLAQLEAARTTARRVIASLHRNQ